MSLLPTYHTASADSDWTCIGQLGIAFIAHVANVERGLETGSDNSGKRHVKRRKHSLPPMRRITTYVRAIVLDKGDGIHVQIHGPFHIPA